MKLPLLLIAAAREYSIIVPKRNGPKEGAAYSDNAATTRYLILDTPANGNFTSFKNLRKKVRMEAITLLKADHHAVEDLLKQIKEVDQSAHVPRRELFRQIDKELTVHSNIEETIFYPALKRKAKSDDDGDATQEVLEAYEEQAKEQLLSNAVA